MKSILLLRPKLDLLKNQRLQTNISHELRCKNPAQDISK